MSPRQLREVVFVDGVRTPFGKAKGQYAETRADDLVIKCIRELMRRNPSLPPERVDEVAVAATTQIGDQGLTIGRTAALLAGPAAERPGLRDRPDVRRRDDRGDHHGLRHRLRLRTTSPSPAASSTWAGTRWASSVDPNPRIMSERLVDPDALVMGKTAENLHDRYPTITKERVDAYAVRSQQKTAAAYDAGKIQPDLVPVATRSAEEGWGLATTDEPMRPETTMESLAGLKTPFRAHGKVTAGNAAGINDGATAALLADEETARELGPADQDAAGVLLLRRRRARGDGRRPDPGHREGAQAGRPHDRRHRARSRSTRRSPCRCSRSSSTSASPTTTRGSTRTAAPSRWATRWPRPAYA